MTDKWKNRSKSMRCGTCMFYVKKETAPVEDDPTVVRAVPVEVGRCRRHAPTMSGWPVMFVGDWCGDHKLDEEKI